MPTNVTTSAELVAEVLDSTVPVLVDFWATWCGPCLAMNPALLSLEKEMGAKLKLVKVNIEEAADLARLFEIRGIPSLYLFYNGEVKSGSMGMMNLKQLRRFVTEGLEEE